MTLRPYQSSSVALTVDAITQGLATLFYLATGGGKTVCAAEVIRLMMTIRRGGRIAFIAHREELINQAYGKLREWGIDPGVVWAQDIGRLDYRKQVQVCSIQTLVRRLDLNFEFDGLVFDECFPAGTMIDGTPIESLREGDTVTTWNGLGFSSGIIKRTMRRRPTALVQVRIGGRSIVTTPEHPFLTESGWVRAIELQGKYVMRKVGDNYEKQNHRKMQRMRGGVRSPRKVSEHLGLHFRKGSPLLLKSMFGRIPKKNIFRDYDAHKLARPEYPFGAHEDQESNVRSNDSGTRKGYATRSRKLEAANPRRKREANTSGRSRSVSRAFVADGGYCSDRRGVENSWVSDALQAGYSKRNYSHRNRSGRQEPSGEGSKKTRLQKGCVPAFARVDSVEILERGCDGRFGGLCPDGFVYNLEVGPDHTYIADGFVVHNCHHLPATTYKTIRRAFPSAWTLGLTATPDGRSDGLRLGSMFDVMIKAATISDLIAQGYLVQPVYTVCRATAPPPVSMEDEEAGQRASAPVVIGNVVDEWMRHARGRSSVYFGYTVSHAEHMAARFRQAGARFETVHGEMGSAERQDILDRLARRELDGVTNCNVLTEGWDFPACECVGLARAFGAIGAYIQAGGRGLRSWPGKSSVRIMDHGGNFDRHGRIELDREILLHDDPAKEKAVREASERGDFARIPQIIRECDARAVNIGAASPQLFAADSTGPEVVEIRKPSRRAPFRVLRG
jgi:superfamily II DNA or RNA helicase